MAMTPMQFSLTIILAFAVYCDCQSNGPGLSSSWAKLQISPDTLSSMEYGNFLIEIYEHANNHKATTTASEKKYFYSPLALLDHTSAVSVYNNVTNQPEMRFRVEMWNDKVQNEVIFNKLANEMRSNPEQFDHLKLLYSLSSQTSQTKQTTISIDSVTSGRMVSTLLQKFGDKKEIFLTANDEKKMLSETATNIRMDTFDDSEVGSPDTETQILNILKDLLVTSRTTIKEQSDKMWDSVFWNEDNYRPDKTTKTLNEIIKKLDTETQRKMAGMFQKAERQSEITEKLTSSNKDAEKRREEQIRRENQSKDGNEEEIRRSQATDQEQSSRNQTRDDKSTTSRDDTDIAVDGVGSDDGVKIATNNSHTHNTYQQNERKENAKKNSNAYDRKMENKEKFQHNYDSNSWADVDRISSTISGKMAIDSDRSRRVEILKEDVEKLLQESRDHIQWDGEKFVPKPMQLSRINLGKFRDSQTFQDRNVRVRYTNAELSAPIKFVEHAELTVTDEWNNLKDELKVTQKELTEMKTITRNMSMELKETLVSLTKRNTELGIVKSDLTNTKFDLASKLEVTRKELAEMKIIAGNLSTELKETVISLTKTNTELSKVKINMRIDLASKLEGTENELAESKLSVKNFSLELKANSQRFGYELKTTEDNLRKELKAILNNLETTTTNLASAKTELSNTKSAVTDLTTKLNARTKEIVDIGQMPTSCWDLQRMGYKLSGVFLVKGLKKIEAVYCDFYPNQNDLQKWIGYADVKSSSTHFYVQKNSTFSTLKTPIPFDLAVVNEGNGMNSTSGIFTAPRPGIYFFSFTGVATFPASSSKVNLYVFLYLNGGYVGTGYVEEANTVTGQSSPLTMQSTLILKKGDRVWVQIDFKSPEVILYDYSGHYTHFTGFALEEEIVASL
ncbi:hypothetical protein DAPPUDRAFT_244756 [Daphnia pulex]|uniref:C1q domain-containing protein n=1 Tax=Daphnia pulex TaxID=6669 RepID=E9GLR4_DAPPU|nr:hypothetical protein DAPPUDRAFT_244756 [Daphnia pulex]|eukprot:EFX79641.1 hypothetical protein DAPPUDRAFT_244756 [Daphnia pulex]